MSDPRLMTVVDAARELGDSPATLWRDIRAGAPVARRGRRGGAGIATLVDPTALRAWRSLRSGADGQLAGRIDDAALRVLASEMPALVARAVRETFAETSGPHKAASAPVLAMAGIRVLVALHERIAQEIPDVPAPEEPEELRLLREIGARTGTRR